MPTDVLRSSKLIKLYRLKKKSGKSSISSLPVLKRWKYWVMVKNEFPYDKIAKLHCLLVPKRKFTEDEGMGPHERKELFKIKNLLGKKFDVVFENSKHRRSIPEHYHLHVIAYKSVIKI